MITGRSREVEGGSTDDVGTTGGDRIELDSATQTTHTAPSSALRHLPFVQQQISKYHDHGFRVFLQKREQEQRGSCASKYNLSG